MSWYRTSGNVRLAGDTSYNRAKREESPFKAMPGKKSKEKIDYCVRQINVLWRWVAQRGENNLFKQEIEKWQQRIYLINKNKI